MISVTEISTYIENLKELFAYRKVEKMIPLPKGVEHYNHKIVALKTERDMSVECQESILKEIQLWQIILTWEESKNDE